MFNSSDFKAAKSIQLGRTRLGISSFTFKLLVNKIFISDPFFALDIGKAASEEAEEMRVEANRIKEEVFGNKKCACCGNVVDDLYDSSKFFSRICAPCFVDNHFS